MKKNRYVVLSALLLAGFANASAVKGKVNFKGTAAKPAELKMNADPNCKNAHKSPVYSETVVVNGNGTLKNVFVYIKDGLAQKYPTPAETVTVKFDQKGCMYAPHVFGIQVGQTLEIHNSDPTLHNVHAMPKVNQQFNVGMPKQGMIIKQKFQKPEIGAKIKCDVHPWMNAYANVVEHPFYAVSDATGAFQIKDVPAGKYTVVAWHEKLGTKEGTLTVEAGKDANLDFEFSEAGK